MTNKVYNPSYKLINRVLYFIGKVNTTAARILVSLVCILATTGAVIIWGNTPSTEFLVFLATISGLDFAQYWSKRVTYIAGGPQDEQEGVQEDDGGVSPYPGSPNSFTR